MDSLDFKYKENGLTESCPNGYRPTNDKIDKIKNLVANFDFQICNQCSMKSGCIALRPNIEDAMEKLKP